MLTNKQIQTNLKFLNFYTGKIDGKIGVGTKSAIKKFQRNFELTIDGIWGTNSNNKCIEVVKWVQKKIGAKVDGIVGAETIDKCIKYQKSVGLVADGIAGCQTRAKLNQSAKYSWKDFPNFQQKDFRCKCGCGYDNINLNLVAKLQKIRNHYGRPLIPTSGCRCEKYNNSLLNRGAIKNSAHLSGNACDFYVKGISKQALLNYCIDLMHKGEIKYTYSNNKNMKGVVHINI